MSDTEGSGTVNGQQTGQLLLLATVTALFVALYTGSQIPADITLVKRKLQSPLPVQSQSRLSLIDSALASIPAATSFKYSGGFENPFRSWQNTTTRPRGKKTKSAVPPRSKFTLKGILIKDKPLAILESEMGETFIRGINEKALEQTIISINENTVVIRDHLGTYELSVEEQ